MRSKLFRTLAAAAATAAGLAGLAPPAAAQPYDYPYGYNPGTQILQGVIDQLLGNRYSVDDRRAVHRCANAALAEAWRQFRPYGYGYDDDYGYGPGYPGYTNYPQMRVTAITSVERRGGGLRVRGLIDSGLLYAMPGVDPRYRQGGDLIFRCDLDYRGRVWDVRVNRNPDFRPPY